MNPRWMGAIPFVRRVESEGAGNMAGGLTGEYMHTLDAKGRLFIPAKLREELGTVFYVTVSPEACLSAYSAVSWDKLVEKVGALPYSKQRAMRPIFAHAAKCEMDSQGRILLPQNLRGFAGLEKNVTIIGFNNRAEIWDTDKWAEVDAQETTPEKIAAAMEECDF